MIDLTATTLVILAGGAGQRMGKPKALLDIHGQPILEWLLDRFAWPGQTLLVTAPSLAAPPGAGRLTRCAIDAVEGNGPLQGVMTALTNLSTPRVAIVTVDMPGVRTSQLEWLIGELDRDPARLGVMCRRDEASPIEPFPCVLRAAAIDAVEQRLRSGRRSVHGLCDLTGFAAITVPADWPANTWINLNFPSDLEAFLSGPSPSGRG